jgi:hypothetical protein
MWLTVRYPPPPPPPLHSQVRRWGQRPIAASVSSFGGEGRCDGRPPCGVMCVRGARDRACELQLLAMRTMGRARNHWRKQCIPTSALRCGAVPAASATVGRLNAPTHETHETRASHTCHTIGINILTLASFPTTCATMPICRAEMMGATKYGIAVKVSFILRWACVLYSV